MLDTTPELPVISYQKKQTKLNWTMDAWKSLNTKVYSLYTNVSKLKYQSAYVMNKTTVSDNTKASVTASNSAVKGTQKLKISQIAQSAYLTGGKIEGNIVNQVGNRTDTHAHVGLKLVTCDRGTS